MSRDLCSDPDDHPDVAWMLDTLTPLVVARMRREWRARFEPMSVRRARDWLSGEWTTAAEIGRRYGLSSQNVRTTLYYARAVGAPIESHKGRGWRLRQQQEVAS